MIVVGILWFHIGCMCVCLSVHPSVILPFVFLFLDDNMSKYQLIFTKLGMCIDIVEIWFGIDNGQISSIFDRFICPPHDSGGILLFHVFI